MTMTPRTVMKVKSKYLRYVVKMTFTIIFITHTSLIALKIRYPDVADLKVSKRHLKDIEFPLNFKLCFHDIENSRSRYQKYGFNYDYDFYRGKSMFNGSVFGWNGHNEFGLTLGPVRGNFANKGKIS